MSAFGVGTVQEGDMLKRLPASKNEVHFTLLFLNRDSFYKHIDFSIVPCAILNYSGALFGMCGLATRTFRWAVLSHPIPYGAVMYRDALCNAV